VFINLFRIIGRLALFIIISVILLIALPRFYVLILAWPKIYTEQEAPPKSAAIVYGAGLNRDGSPGAVLRDRVATAADLYFAGKVDKLLMSGDNRFVDYNEPGAMGRYALSLGVPEEDIVLDFAGRRTYDTCYRALHIFGVSEAILVTQRFHLPRALYLCNALGIEAVGVSADRNQYRRGPYLYWNLREILATTNALWEVNFARPLPILGQYEPIFPDEPDQRRSDGEN
jgi:SanA protein